MDGGWDQKSEILSLNIFFNLAIGPVRHKYMHIYLWSMLGLLFLEEDRDISERVGQVVFRNFGAMSLWPRA